MKRSIKYWEERSIERESLYQARANKTIAEIQKAYDRAFFNIEKEFLAASKQFELKGGFSAEDAEAYAYRMNRLKAMQKQVYAEFAKLRKIEERTPESFYAELIEDSFYRNIFDIQRGTGLGFTFNLIPENTINEILRSKWKGRNYSDSVWRNTGKLASMANEIISAGFTAGTSIQGMTKQLNDLGLHELKETGKFVAERLIRTEVNYFANQGELKAYDECGIEKYRYVATLDIRTSELCRGLDGLVEAVKNAVVSKNYPPMHPFCRSTTIAVIEGETIEGLRRKARDPVTGKTYTVPADMKYRDWYKEYVAPKKEALLAEQMQKNRVSDKAQHEKYVETLGKKAVQSFDKFLEMKYNNSEGYARLKRSYKQTLQSTWEAEVLNREITQGYTAYESSEDLPAWLTGQIDHWTEEEQEALNYYTSSSFEKINRHLRGKADATEETLGYISDISGAINKADIQENIVLWRGASFSNFVDGDRLREMPLESWINESLTDKAFVSTSVVRGQEFSKEIFMEILIPKNKKGAYLAELSEYSNEQEVLLQKSSLFRIIEAEMRSGKYYMKVLYKGADE